MGQGCGSSTSSLSRLFRQDEKGLRIGSILFIGKLTLVGTFDKGLGVPSIHFHAPGS